MSDPRKMGAYAICLGVRCTRCGKRWGKHRYRDNACPRRGTEWAAASRFKAVLQ
jgi:hypothetical protein